MRSFIAMLAAGAALMAGPAIADTMANAAGNTVVVTYANGAAARYHFNTDGSFAATLPDGSALTGIWNVADGQICFLPTEGGARQCTPYVADKNVGDTWTQTAADGSTISVTLQAGR